MVVGSPLQPCAAKLVPERPRNLGHFPTLSVDQVKLLIVVNEGNDVTAPSQEVVHCFAVEIRLTRKRHGQLGLADVQNGDTVVRAHHKVVVRVLQVARQLLNLVDHA